MCWFVCWVGIMEKYFLRVKKLMSVNMMMEIVLLIRNVMVKMLIIIY